jgi:hypothetical protein
MAENDASAPESLPMGVRAEEMMTEPGIASSPKNELGARVAAPDGAQTS